MSRTGSVSGVCGDVVTLVYCIALSFEPKVPTKQCTDLATAGQLLPNSLVSSTTMRGSRATKAFVQHRNDRPKRELQCLGSRVEPWRYTKQDNHQMSLDLDSFLACRGGWISSSTPATANSFRITIHDPSYKPHKASHSHAVLPNVVM